ncbi:helix-turn-helix domain-containing protein [uncultured Clostridium sp.]|uniref:helix-turn-helix domain-containing protein n=1 Tax=uncultured Clostridium sp. TaxID=59620 RepID=UPI0026DB984A|nr:helix-turn-helix transcriptional regulator [uncultured Clostridium sp.]
MNNKEIGNKIKSIRQSQGLSREQLAEKLNVTKYAIINYEQGQRGASIKILNKIAEALGVPLSEILGTNATTNDIGNKIISAQSLNNISHEELAEKTGIDEKHLRTIKAGQINPTTTELSKIANVLGLPLRYFIKNLASDVDDAVIEDEHDPIELQIKYGIHKEVMTRDELYSLINFYINKTSILSKEKSIAIQKLEAITEIINNK